MSGSHRFSTLTTVAAAIVVLMSFIVTDLAFAAGGGGGASGVGGSFGSSSSRERRDPAPIYREGFNHYKNGEYDSAAEKFEEVLDISSRDTRANYYLGLIRLDQGDAEAAKKHLRRAVRSDDELYDARAHLGIAYLRLGDERRAEREREELAEAREKCRSDCPDYLADRIDEALRILDAAMAGEEEKDPAAGARLLPQGLPGGDLKDAETAYTAAVALINEGRYDDAIRDLKAIGAVVGPHPDILNYLGFAYRKIGRFDTALEYYSQALAIDPEHKGANEYLGELYVQIGDMENAFARLEMLDALCPFGCAEQEDLRRIIRAAR